MTTARRFLTTGYLSLSLLAAACQSPIAEQNRINVPPSLAPSEEIVEVDSLQAPDFRLQSLTGDTIGLDEAAGRWVIVNFWATWCTPCAAEMPYLDALSAEHSDHLLVLAINMREPRDTVDSFVQEYDLSLPILISPDDEILIAYQVTALPLTVAISPEGTVARRFTGPLTPEDFEPLLHSILQQ